MTQAEQRNSPEENTVSWSTVLAQFLPASILSVDYMPIALNCTGAKVRTSALSFAFSHSSVLLFLIRKKNLSPSSAVGSSAVWRGSWEVKSVYSMFMVQQKWIAFVAVLIITTWTHILTTHWCLTAATFAKPIKTDYVECFGICAVMDLKLSPSTLQKKSPTMKYYTQYIQYKLHRNTPVTFPWMKSNKLPVA